MTGAILKGGTSPGQVSSATPLPTFFHILRQKLLTTLMAEPSVFLHLPLLTMKLDTIQEVLYVLSTKTVR